MAKIGRVLDRFTEKDTVVPYYQREQDSEWRRQKIWCILDVPAENTKTGCWYELSAPIASHIERLRKITKTKTKTDLLFRNQTTGKEFSDRIWRDGLLEMLVEAGSATWAEQNLINQRKVEISSDQPLI